LEIVRGDEEAYLIERVAYWLHLEGYKYDRLIGKLVEVLVTIFQKNSLVQAAIVATSFQSEHVVTTIEELEPIRGGTKLAIVSCTLPLPIKFMEVIVVVVCTQVKALEELMTPKPIPLVILDTRIGVEVTLIDNITHAFEVFKTIDIILKGTPIKEGLRFQLIILAEPIDTIGKQPIDDLAA
jgi:hypothetical protein